MEEIVLYLLYQITDYLRYIFVFTGIFQLKITENKKKIGSVCVLFCVGTVIIYKLVPNMSFLNGVVFGGITFLLFQNKYLTRILMYIPIYMCVDFLDEMFAIIAGVLLDFNPLLISGYEHILYKLAVSVPSFTVLLIITIVNSKKIKQTELTIYVTGKLYCLILISLVCAVLLMSLVSYIGFTPDKEAALYFMQSVTFLTIIVVVVILLLIFYVYFFFRTQEIQKDMLKLLEKKNELQNEYYLRLYEKSEEMRGFRHDYHHHVSYLVQQMKLKNYDEVQEYLDTLNIYGEQILTRKEIYSGNRVIDAVIYGIFSKKENEEIKFFYQGKVRQHLNIKDIDLCIVLSNVLENAVDACRKCGEKRIDMEIMTHNENMIIQIKNTYVPELYNGLYTDKVDKENHGYGVQNVLRVIEKYDGSLKYVGEKMFCVKIQLNEKL